MIREQLVITLSGPSGVGKSYIVDLLTSKYGFQAPVPFTSRTSRQNEVNGVDYHFLDLQSIRDLSHNFKRGYWAQPIGKHWYGYRDNISALQGRWIIQVYSQLAFQMKKDNPTIITVQIDYADIQTMEQRIKGRFVGEKEFEARLLFSKKERQFDSFYDFKFSSNSPPILAEQLLSALTLMP